MEAFNLTPSDSSTFILSGIPGLEDGHIWISIPFFVLYIICLLGNVMVLFVVSKEQTLHKPMFLLLCMLALTDIGMSTCIVPKALSIFWFSSKVITVDGCLTQIFFLYMIGTTQSAVLVIMAFDRYVAIFSRMYSLVILLVVIGLDQTLIGLSYGLIIRAVLRISSKKAHRKALNTCTPHICVMVIACTTSLFSTVTHRFGQGIAAHVHVLLANLYLLVSPTFNPIIYGVKIKELRDKLGKYTCRM
ncbi:olfactory receptor 52P1-like [Emydura macquarii macquarii]|uniref:olfactory receptor 52P1-like n=1 Tax=Emydura macquarii macquarii TaxID=1129001 RepID=UPI003529EBA2